MSSTSDLTPVLAAIGGGFAALYMLLKPAAAPAPAPAAASQSPEVRALADSVRLLLEQQQRQNTSNSSAPHWSHDYATPSSARNRAPSSSSGGASSSSSSIPADVVGEFKALQEAVKNLERKNRELNRQLTLTEVSNVVDVEKKYRLPIPVTDLSSSSAGQPQQLNLSATEIETIRAIFNMFDTSQTGTISTRELSALHKQLGEPLTDEEATAAIAELDQEGTGSVNFNKFLIWWYHGHTSGKKGSAYTQRFKLMHAKLTTNEFNVDQIITQHSGEIFTLEYRLNFYYKSNAQSLKPISPWHDIPLNRVGSGEQGQLFNFVCEIPKWTRAKFECATGELYNPIKQDTQHGKLRYYKHGDMMFNYGYFPQTWEDPEVTPVDTGYAGDNDPVDCVEIGAMQMRVGGISAVKVLGVLGLIDDGETDWKVIAINISDPMAHLLNDIDDVEVHLPGAVKAIREYFRDYKSFSGKINSYALRAQAMPRHYALKVIEETHQHWKSLHLIKKRHIIGESSLQAESRLSSVAPVVAAVAATEQPTHSQAKFAAANASPRLASTVSPRIAGAAGAVPVMELSGAEQPVDRLSSPSLEAN